MSSRISASSARAPRDIRSASSTSASRPRPGRSARASRTPWAWRSPRSCWRRSSTAKAAAIVDHHTYCFVGRRLPHGRHLARGLLARRHLKLGKLIVFYDDNGISIDGKVVGLVHRRHAEALRGLRLARDEECRRTRCRSGRRRHQEGARAARISRRSSAARPSSAGARLTSRAPSPRTARRWARKKWRNARKTLGWESPPFVDSGRHPRRLGSQGSGRRRREEVECASSSATSANIPRGGAEFERRMKGDLPANWAGDRAGSAGRGRRGHGLRRRRAPRRSSRSTCSGPKLPEMLGGSADLTGSVNTQRKDSVDLTTRELQAATTSTTACANSA